MEKNKVKIIEYENELTDDFANNSIVTKKIDENYRYIKTGFWYKIWSNIIRYLVALPILWFTNVFICKVRIKNKKVIKKAKKTGYYLYSNHVLDYDPIIAPILMEPTRYCVIVASEDTFSINRFITYLVRVLGGIPVPKTMKMYKNYKKCLEYHISKKHRILIYPEEHIWPYYNGIRNFKSVSFRYPVDDDVPVFTMTTTFRAPKKPGRKPHPVIYIDGPFYPNHEISRKEAIEELRNSVYKAMKDRSDDTNNYEFIKYIKKTNDNS